MLSKAFIDLQAIKFNANAVKNKLNGKAKLCAVVKSDAYGHGIEQVANALYTICDEYAVSTIQEGLRLRRIGIDKPVLVMVPYLKDASLGVERGLTLAVQNVYQMQKLSQSAEKIGKIAKVHLCFNSGMNRFGANLTGISDMIDFACVNEWVKIDGLFSHYASPQDDSARLLAKRKFLLANKLVKHYNRNTTCHISASGGFLKGDYFDMVRIGILLYGYKPFNFPSFSVKPAMSVYAPVINTRRLTTLDGCLYGLQRPTKKCKVSIIGYGYADGLPRRPSNAQFNNKCMDASAYYGAKKGFYPVMLNADKVAREYGTISYEVLTKCALRSQKIYV